MAFGDIGGRGLAVVEALVDVVFWADIAVNFRTAFYNDHHRIVSERRAIALRYARGWLAVDLASSLPIGAVVDAVAGSAGNTPQAAAVATMARVLRLLKLIRLLRLLRLGRISRRLVGASSGYVITHARRPPPLLVRAALSRAAHAAPYQSATPGNFPHSSLRLRLVLFGGGTILITHMVACFWYFVASVSSPDLRDTWVEDSGDGSAGGA